MKVRGLAFLLAAVLVSGSLPVVNKLGLNHDLPILTFLAARMSIAAIALWAILLCFDPKSVWLDRAGMIGCLQVSILSCLSSPLYLWALVYIDVSLSMLVFATAYAPMIMILSRFRGTEPTGLDLLRFLIALIGIYLFIERSGSLSIIGILLTVLNVFIYGTISSILLAVLLLNEVLAPIQWVGSFPVVFSVALVSMRPGINKLIPFMRRMNILINP